MADLGVWFKLWCAALDDPALDNLDICDFGRWAKLGAFVKRHGEAGTVHLTPPARALCSALQVPDFDALMSVFARLPGVTVRRDNSAVPDETTATVSFSNWAKYQGDFSTYRTRKWRERKRSRGEEKRGEEKRREESRGIPPRVVLSDDQFLASLRANPAYRGLDIEAELGKLDAWLLTPRGQGKQRTRQRIVNWLNRAELPVHKAGSRQRLNEAWTGREPGDRTL